MEGVDKIIRDRKECVTGIEVPPSSDLLSSDWVCGGSEVDQAWIALVVSGTNAPLCGLESYSIRTYIMMPLSKC